MSFAAYMSGNRDNHPIIVISEVRKRKTNTMNIFMKQKQTHRHRE